MQVESSERYRRRGCEKDERTEEEQYIDPLDRSICTPLQFPTLLCVPNNYSNMFDLDAFNRGRIAHGVLMSLAVIVFFPLGGVLIRLLKHPSTARIHIALQLLGLAVLIAGFGLGLWVQDQINIVGDTQAASPF